MSEVADFDFEILQYVPGSANPKTAPVALPAALIESFGSINRAAERDLFSFKTGDITLVFRNADGFFDDLFAFMEPRDRWQLRVYRRGVIQFWGVVMGVGSVIFDRTDKTCEVTAYGLSRILKDSNGAAVSRGVMATLPQGTEIGDTTLIVDYAGGFAAFDIIHIYRPDYQVTEVRSVQFPDQIKVSVLMGDNYPPGSEITKTVNFMDVATATSGSSTLTLTSPGDGTDATAGLVTGDTLHITDQLNAEDVVVKQVTSATVVSLVAVLANTHAAGSPVDIATPFYRYRTISSLVDALFRAAGIPASDIRLSASQFNRLAPTPVSINRLGIANDFRRGVAERNEIYYVHIAGDGSYYQDQPEDDWTREDTTDSGWQDWSKYYLESETKPTIFLRFPFVGDSNSINPQTACFDWKPATKTMYFIANTGASTLRKQDTTDGTTWTANVLITALPFAENAWIRCTEFDPTRNLVVCSWNNGTTDFRFQQWDVVGAAWTTMKQPGDVGTDAYLGPTYVPELDAVLVLRTSGVDVVGTPPDAPKPPFEICAFRGTTMLWRRPFPNCLIAYDGAYTIPADGVVFPTRSIRSVGGVLYATVISDGAVQLVTSDDEFMSYKMAKIVNATSDTMIMTARVMGQYRIACYRATAPTGHYVAAPFYAGVIEYFDLEGKSVSDGLNSLAQISNAIAWVDDEQQGHFVARDLYDPGAVIDITDRIKTRRETLIWDQTAEYVEVSGSETTAVSGNKAFAASGITIDSDLVPNEAFAQALADSYQAFYGQRRKEMEISVHDPDGHIYQPLDRVTIDGIRWLVYESDHDLVGDAVSLKLLEDV